MKLLALTDLSFILILVSNSEGQDWNISVPEHINTTRGSNVIIPCTFTYPPKYYTKDVQVHWKKPGRFKTQDLDKNVFVFHTNDTFVLEQYRGKTKLVGDQNNGDCTLMIKNVVANDRQLYVRIAVNRQNYSFKMNPVSISVNGVKPDIIIQDSTSPPLYTPTANNMHTGETTLEPLLLYVAIFVPLSVLVIIILSTSAFCWMKQKRSKSLARESSGYYANFSRSTSSLPQREVLCTNKENKKLSDLKVIDEPVYVNTEDLRRPMDDRTDHLHNIYANYSG